MHGRPSIQQSELYGVGQGGVPRWATEVPHRDPQVSSSCRGHGDRASAQVHSIAIAFDSAGNAAIISTPGPLPGLAPSAPWRLYPRAIRARIISRSLFTSKGFSRIGLGTAARKSRARWVVAPPVMNTMR